MDTWDYWLQGKQTVNPNNRNPDNLKIPIRQSLKIKPKISFWKYYSETLNNEYIERIHPMSYFSLSDNGMLQIFSFLIKWLYGTL